MPAGHSTGAPSGVAQYDPPGHTGAVDPAESKITALRRELREEVSAELDADFLPVYLGGWQIARARAENGECEYT